eukprot:gene14089-15561_t
MNRANTTNGRLYIGNLPDDIRSRDLEDIFYKYGSIRGVELKVPKGRGNPYAFLEFDDERDAEDAIRGRDGYEIGGYRIRVEFPKTGRDFNDGGGFWGGRGRGYSRGGRGGGRGSGPPRRSDYRVLISGLPPSGSWQDLKDHMREAGDVLYSEVFKDGTGVVEFARKDDMKWAIKNLDDTKFKSHEGESGYVRVKDDAKSRSRSNSPSRRRDYSRSRSRSRSESKDRSSHHHSRSRSRS